MTAALFSSFSPDGIFRPPKLPPVQPPLEKHRPPCLTTAPPPPPWTVSRLGPLLRTPEPLGGVPWPLQPASGRSKGDTVSTFNE